MYVGDNQSASDVTQPLPELRAYRDVVLAAVQKSGEALEYASDDLKADKEVVLAAVQQEGDALRCQPWLLRQREAARKPDSGRGVSGRVRWIRGMPRG